METTKHAQARSQQRGIPKGQIEMILEFGTPHDRPGNAIEYVITKKDKEKALRHFKKKIQQIDKAGNKGVLISRGDDTIITVYNKH